MVHEFVTIFFVCGQSHALINIIVKLVEFENLN